MKHFITFSLLLFSFCSFGQIPDSTWKVDTIYEKCEGNSHDFRWVALTYPPCYCCMCGRHLRFDSKTYMALEIKYGDSVDSEVRKYMKSGRWAKGEKMIDSLTVEKLAGKRHDKLIEAYRELIREFSKKQQ